MCGLLHVWVYTGLLRVNSLVNGAWNHSRECDAHFLDTCTPIKTNFSLNRIYMYTSGAWSKYPVSSDKSFLTSKEPVHSEMRLRNLPLLQECPVQNSSVVWNSKWSQFFPLSDFRATQFTQFSTTHTNMPNKLLLHRSGSLICTEFALWRVLCVLVVHIWSLGCWLPWREKTTSCLWTDQLADTWAMGTTGTGQEVSICTLKTASQTIYLPPDFTRCHLYIEEHTGHTISTTNASC